MELTVTMVEIQGQTFEDLAREVVRRREPLRMQLDTGETVILLAASAPDYSQGITASLKPLPLLSGFVPEGWKEAVYDIGGF